MRVKSIYYGVACALISACGAALATAAAAQAYPARAVRLIIPFSAGGAADVPARILTQRMSESLGQQVIVDNRPGLGSAIGAELAAKAPPDGYTLFLLSNTHFVTAALHKKLPYDPLNDYAPITQITSAPNVLVVHPSLPARTAKEFIALAKARPGQLLMASAGAGSNTHLTGELFQVVAGVKFTHVPYKGGGPAVIDLVAGQTQLMFDQVTTSTPHVKAGKLRAIAVAFPKRSPVLPDVPTMVESGVNDFEAATVTGIFLPAATPKEIVNRVYTALIKVLDQPATRDAFTRLGAEVIKSTPEELGKRVRDDLARWKKVQQQTGIRID